jgi:hypothetical protein
MKLYSPDGTAEVDAHPSKVESMLAKGWMPEINRKQNLKLRRKLRPKIKLKKRSLKWLHISARWRN